MKTLSFDPIRADVAITEKEKSAALHANALLHNGQGAGNDFLGWVGLPSALDEEELQAIETEAARLRDLAEVILCIGLVDGDLAGAGDETDAGDGVLTTAGTLVDNGVLSHL